MVPVFYTFAVGSVLFFHLCKGGDGMNQGYQCDIGLRNKAFSKSYEPKNQPTSYSDGKPQNCYKKCNTHVLNNYAPNQNHWCCEYKVTRAKPGFDLMHTCTLVRYYEEDKVSAQPIKAESDQFGASYISYDEVKDPFWKGLDSAKEYVGSAFDEVGGAFVSFFQIVVDVFNEDEAQVLDDGQ